MFMPAKHINNTGHAMHLDPRPFVGRLRWIREYPVYPESPARFALRTVRFTLGEQMAATRSHGGRFEFAACDGCVFTTPPNNVSSFIAAVFGQRDMHVFRFWQRALKPGAVFFDVGANIGLYAVPACQVVGAAGRVVCFEAHPSTYAFLARNLARNCNGTVTAENMAVGSGPGEIQIAFDARNPGETHIARGDERGDTVPMMALDDYCARKEIRRVDYLKIDVEGYETEVLRGAQRIITANEQILIQTEYEPKHLSRYGDPTAMTTLLLNTGFLPHELAWRDGKPSRIAALPDYTGEIIWSRRDLGQQAFDA
jgi:FkbM family methyltransferase